MSENTENTVDIQSPKQNKPWQFKPGQSGNPKGKPRGSRNLSTILESAIRRIDKDVGLPHDVIIIKKTIEQAKRGDRYARDLIFDRLEGKAPQTIDITSDGEPLNQNVAEAISKVYGRPAIPTSDKPAS